MFAVSNDLNLLAAQIFRFLRLRCEQTQALIWKNIRKDVWAAKLLVSTTCINYVNTSYLYIAFENNTNLTHEAPLFSISIALASKLFCAGEVDIEYNSCGIGDG